MLDHTLREAFHFYSIIEIQKFKCGFSPAGNYWTSGAHSLIFFIVGLEF